MMNVPRMATHTRPLPGMSVRDTAHAMRHAEDGAERGRRQPDHHGIDERLDVTPAAVGRHVVVDREGAVRVAGS